MALQNTNIGTLKMDLYKSLVLPQGPRGSFPVILAHCVYSHVLWRNYENAQRKESEESKEATSTPASPFYPLITAYFCYGYGGGTVRDWVMAQPPIAFTNPDILVGWVWGYLCVYMCPKDALYETCKAEAPFNPIKAFFMGMDAIDSAGGVCASCEKAARLFPENPNAPFVAGMLISLGGSLFRYLEQKSRGKNPQTEWAKPTSVFKRGLFYTILYLLLRRWKGDPSQARLALVSMHLSRVMLQNAIGLEIFPFLV